MAGDAAGAMAPADDIFISYARPTVAVAHAVSAALQAAGHRVWFDDALPAHRPFADVIEERLRAARVVVVIWSAAAAKSHWVRAEADVALKAGTLVQLSVDGTIPPMPFNQVHCVDFAGHASVVAAPAWARVTASIQSLLGRAELAATPAVTAPPPASDVTEKPSIAVLPFANLSGNPEQDYFADGMVEEIATALSRIKSLFVISGNSSRALKGSNITPGEAATTLGVRYVLEGSVRAAGGRVRIALGLIDTNAGARIWSDRFDDTMEDVFALQDRVALAVAGVIEPAVQIAEMARALKRPTQSLGSYDLYLRALHQYQSLAPDDVRQALLLVDQALAIDPRNAAALALGADCHAQAVVVRWGSDLAAHRRDGLAMARRAMQVAPDDPEVLARAVAALWQLGDNLKTLIAHVDRATTLNPGSALAWATSGWIRLIFGDPARAVSEFRTAMRLDPISSERPAQQTGLAIGQFCDGQFDDAIALASEAVQRKPGLQVNHVVLAASHAMLGQDADARAALAAFAAGHPGGNFRDWLSVFGNPEHRAIALAAIERIAG
ncbi:MAG: CadC-family transcriptional regulator [Alphaproteobacteria bacterium PA4]|nr:MAG: CadC-family transcriptional regulator [Alphaproteobacteria bacterium PA4]